MTEVFDALHHNLLTCDESLIHSVTTDIMVLYISVILVKAMELNVSHLIITLFWQAFTYFTGITV